MISEVDDGTESHLDDGTSSSQIGIKNFIIIHVHCAIHYRAINC